MPELKDHVSLAHISLELEQPFWAMGRMRRERRQKGGGWTRGKMRSVKKEERESRISTPQETLDPVYKPSFHLELV